MNRRFVDRFLLVGTSRALDGINWNRWYGRTGRICTTVLSDHWSGFAVGGIFQVQNEVGTNAVYPFGMHLVAGDGLVLQDNSSNVDGCGIELGA